MGTELMHAGLKIETDIAESWVLHQPEVVASIHRAYASAGAALVQTCSFGALASRLRPYGLHERVREICIQSVALARRAERPVVASLGPSGRSALEASAPGLEEEFAEAARALAEAGVDAIHLETQCAPAELLAAARGIRRVAGQIPLWISISLITGNTGLETPYGFPAQRMLSALAEAAPDAVGVNCSLDADRMRAAVQLLVDENLGPVIARPQARMSEKCAGRSKEPPERFAATAMHLFDLGAAAVGGCCGTGPAAIAALFRSMSSRKEAL